MASHHDHIKQHHILSTMQDNTMESSSAEQWWNNVGPVGVTTLSSPDLILVVDEHFHVLGTNSTVSTERDSLISWCVARGAPWTIWIPRNTKKDSDGLPWKLVPSYPTGVISAQILIMAGYQRTEPERSRAQSAPSCEAADGSHETLVSRPMPN